MSKDQAYGWVILLVSLAVIAGYVWVVFFPPAVGLDVLVLKLTGTLAIVFGFGVLAWIGYTLATTPPPEPIDMTQFDAEAEQTEVGDKGVSESRKEPTGEGD
jgi:predicted DNA-binding transcriptional regulator